MAEATEMTLARRLFDRVRWQRAADALAMLVAVSLPWSTSATSFLVVLWLIALIPTLDGGGLRRTLAEPAGGLPVMLWALALIGMAWSDSTLADRIYSFGGFHKLLVIPLLLLQFRRSDRGVHVVIGFLVSCAVLLLVSWTYTVFPALPGHGRYIAGVPVKEYVIQSGEFALCIFALGHLAVSTWQARRRLLAMILMALALLFLANVVYVAASRAMLIALAVLVLILGRQRFGWKGIAATLVAGALLAGSAWTSSSYLRSRITGVVNEIGSYETRHAETSSGIRLEFWKKSVQIVASAPVMGHGTGSIEDQFRRVASDDSQMSALVTQNPHNQTLVIAIQFGLIGVAVLYAMWLSHLLLFGGSWWASWLGLGVVVQGMVASLFDSQLFYFTPGWIYVFGVGVLGGMALGVSSPERPDSAGWRGRANAAKEMTGPPPAGA